MELSTDKIKIILSSEEASIIAYHIRHSLERSILNHYISTHHDSYKRGLPHAQELFEKQCRKDLEMMKSLIMMAYGRDGEWIEEEVWEFLKKSYAEKNNT